MEFSKIIYWFFCAILFSGSLILTILAAPKIEDCSNSKDCYFDPYVVEGYYLGCNVSFPTMNLWCMTDKDCPKYGKKLCYYDLNNCYQLGCQANGSWLAGFVIGLAILIGSCSIGFVLIIIICLPIFKDK